eukprot:gene4980-5100_t
MCGWGAVCLFGWVVWIAFSILCKIILNRSTLRMYEMLPLSGLVSACWAPISTLLGLPYQICAFFHNNVTLVPHRWWPDELPFSDADNYSIARK